MVAAGVCSISIPARPMTGPVTPCVMALRQTRRRTTSGSPRRTLTCLPLSDPTGSPVFYPGLRLEGRLAADTARRLGLRLIAPIVSVSANPRSSQAERSVPGLQMWQNWRISSHWAGLLSSECLVGRLMPLPAPLAFPTASGAWRLSGAWDRSRTSNSLAIWSD